MSRQEPPAPKADGIGDPLSVIVRWARVGLYDRLLDTVGLEIERSAMAILGTIATHGPMRTSELAGFLGLDRSTVSRQVGAAIEAGYVASDTDTQDARALRLSLTPEGRRVQQKLRRAWIRLTTRMIADWPETEQAELARLLTKLSRTLGP